MLKDREDFYIELIKESKSFLEVCRKANISSTTGNYDTLKRIVKEHNISLSHFKRLGCVDNKEKNIQDYLSNKYPISSYKLKNKLIKYGYKNWECEKCGCTEWLNKKVPLELHHVNGDNTDNNLGNLMLLCPNCHAQTNNFGGKNQRINKKCG